VATKQSVDLSDLKLDDEHAKAILNAAIEAEAYSEDMPKTRKDRINAAGEQIGMMLDAYLNEDVTPDNDDEEVAEMGEMIEEILEIAGIEVDDGEVTFGDLPDLDGEDDADDDNGDDDGDGEAAVDINDIVDGYEDLSAASRVKALKALELDPDDDDDYNTLVAVEEWEKAQDKPSSRVLNWLGEVLPEEDGDGDSDDDDDADADDDDNGGDGDTDEEPWKGYDKATAAAIRKVLDEEFKKGNLSEEQIQYVRDYEEGREKPPTRKNVLKKCDELLASIEENGQPEAEAEEEDEKPARSGRRGSRRSAKADDEEKPAAKAGRSSWGAKGKGKTKDKDDDAETGVLVISSDTEDNITAYGPLGAAGAVADLLMSGATEVTVTAG
jgi:hypothetical protein